MPDEFDTQLIEDLKAQNAPEAQPEPQVEQAVEPEQEQKPEPEQPKTIFDEKMAKALRAEMQDTGYLQEKKDKGVKLLRHN